MAKHEPVEAVEVAVEQLSFVPGEPSSVLHVARRWWAEQQDVLDAAPRRVGPASAALPTTVQLGSTTFRRLIDVPGERLEAALAAWWRRCEHGDGNLRLDGPEAVDGSFQLRGSFRKGTVLRRIPIEVRLSPYGGLWTLLELTPRRMTRPSRRYFRLGHASLDRFVAGLCAEQDPAAP